MEERTMSMVAIAGNTYPVKDQIKALGGRWNADAKVWMVPADKAEEARKIVANAPRSTYSNFRRRSNGGRCRGCRGPIRNAPHHHAMGGYCGYCAFDEFDC
jgi:hypothetical protein